MRLRTTIERGLVFAIAGVFLSPLALTLIGNSPKHFPWPLNHPWIGNRSLDGVTIETPDVRFSWGALASGAFQKSKASRFNEGFGGREALIRLTNEIWFRLFRQTTNPASQIVVGRNGSLFERFSVAEYFSKRRPKESFAPLVADLRRLQDYCRARGMGFVLVVSPSKASIYPEETPRAWRAAYDERPRGGVYLRELLRENDIAFVDGTALLTAEKAAHPQRPPLFAKGATHWNDRAGWLVANAALAQFQAQGQPLEPLEISETIVTDHPEGADKDLVRLMNLAIPWIYPVETIVVRPSSRPTHDQRTLAVVGSSFTWAPLRHLSASRQFSEVAFFFHYRLYKSRAQADSFPTVRTPATPLAFDEEIFAADCLLLEINDASIVEPEHHLSAFLADALAHLPEPSAARRPFRSGK